MKIFNPNTMNPAFFREQCDPLTRALRELKYLRGRARYANAAATPSPYPGYFPVPPGQPPPGSQCPPTTRFPCASLVSKATEDTLRGRNRTGNYRASPPLGGLLPGANTGLAFDAALSPGALDTWSAGVAPMWRTVQFVDLIGSGLTDLDDLAFDIFVSGVPRANFNGGIFSRSNANACTPACGITVCAGPLESITVTVTNQTAAALGATATVKLTTRTVYSGEAGFTCSEEGSCAPPAPAAFAPACGCEEGGE